MKNVKDGNGLFKKYIVCKNHDISGCYMDLVEIVDIIYEGTNDDDMVIYLAIRKLYTYYDGIKTRHPTTLPIVYTLNSIKNYLVFESDSYDECLKYINTRIDMEKYNL